MLAQSEVSTKNQKLYPKSVAKDNADRSNKPVLSQNSMPSVAWRWSSCFSKKRPSSSIRKGKRVNRGEASSSEQTIGAEEQSARCTRIKMKQCKAAVWDIAKNDSSVRSKEISCQ